MELLNMTRKLFVFSFDKSLIFLPLLPFVQNILTFWKLWWSRNGIRETFPLRESLLKYKWDSGRARVETWNEVDQKPLFFTNLYHGKIVSCSINLSNSEWLFKKLNRSEELFVFATIEHSSYGGKAKGDAVNSKYVKKKKKKCSSQIT